MTDDALLAQIEADNDYFKSMINLVPPHFYFGTEPKNQASGEITLEEPNETWSNDKKRKKTVDSEQRRDIKKLKFDPTQFNSVTQIQEQLVAQEHRDKSLVLKGRKNKAEGIEELRKKLKSKIVQIRNTKKHLTQEQKQELRKEARNKSNKHKQKTKHDPAPKSLPKKSPKVKPPTAKPVFNKDGKMVFSKFDFSKKDKKNKDEKNLAKLLEKVQKDKEKIDNLKEADKDAAKIAVEKAQWKKALQKAEGVKIKDDVQLIKKSMKRQEKKKEKSAKQWDERTAGVEKKKKDKQTKRKENIKKKKQSNIERKVKRAKKRGRLVPGF